MVESTTKMSENQKFELNDRVRHVLRPEWGIGTIVKVEPVVGGGSSQGVSTNGAPPQRLSIRFPNGGLKTLVSSHAELERVNGTADLLTEPGATPSPRIWDLLNESEWLAPVARKKVDEAMISVPTEVRDPFNSMQKRLSIMLGLYRFTRFGKSLIDWAVAQTGLDDPLSKFTRQELEQRFERWVFERDNYLAKLLAEARNDQAALAEALRTAPPSARDAVRRIIGSR
jgi:hypothetical protein